VTAGTFEVAAKPRFPFAPTVKAVPTQEAHGGSVSLQCKSFKHFGFVVTMAGTEHGAPYCPLCLFPRFER
jgi:hypothetical protein